jgi:hypothetical protein
MSRDDTLSVQSFASGQVIEGSGIRIGKMPDGRLSTDEIKMNWSEMSV